MANQTIANLIHESNFKQCLSARRKSTACSFSRWTSSACWFVIFRAQVSVGVVKYFSAPAAAQIAEQFQAATSRSLGTSGLAAGARPTLGLLEIARRFAQPPALKSI